MNTIRGIAFGAGLILSAAAFAGSAYAQSNEDIRGITVPLGVYDTKNSWIGTFAGSNGYQSYALHPYGNTWYLIQFTRKGILNNAYFFFANSSCTGQRFIYVSDSAPLLLSFDGSTLWAPSTSQNEQIVTVKSYSSGGNCYQYNTPQDSIYGVATAIDTTAGQLLPPFTVE
jgi:hypothetical protein